MFRFDGYMWVRLPVSFADHFPVRQTAMSRLILWHLRGRLIRPVLLHRSPTGWAVCRSVMAPAVTGRLIRATAVALLWLVSLLSSRVSPASDRSLPALTGWPTR